MKLLAQIGLGFLLCALALPWSGLALGAGQSPGNRLAVTVVDENSVPVPSARIGLLQSGKATAQRCETDYAGRCDFSGLVAGIYDVRAEKEGFYAVTSAGIHVGETESLEITLNHQQEYLEVTNVVASPPAIDPSVTASTEHLGSREIVDIPFLVRRDIRYALPLIPGVLQDASSQVHVDGAATRQTVDELDGFNVTSPVSGNFALRVSADAIRSVEVQGGRTSAEFGKGSGGLIRLNTGMGDDHFRFYGTDFLPGLQNQRGFYINTWTPRLTLSGPLQKGKSWFLEALDGEYGQRVFTDLPPGADRTRAWRISSLSKAQINLTQSNILTGSLVVNHFHSAHAGLSRFTPVESTLGFDQSASLFSVRDQAYLSNGTLLEAGIGWVRFRDGAIPLGTLPYRIRPEAVSGNFFETVHAHSQRFQAIANVILPPRQWHGRHELKFGADLDPITDLHDFRRRPILIFREDGTRSRETDFGSAPPFGRNNFEASAYAQDRWAPSDRAVLETGLRFDRDQIVRRLLLSPRLAASYLLAAHGDTKLTAGIGLFYESSDLRLITQPLAGSRTDLIFGPDGEAFAQPPLVTSFQIDDRHLRAPQFLNWSVGLERKLPAAIYLRLEFLEKRGQNGWAFAPQASTTPGLQSGLFEFRQDRRDRYDSLQVTARHTFRRNYVWFASYVRSRARSNEVLEFSLDNPVFSSQAGGALPWDAPNRLISWGLLPLKRGFELAYSLDWRTGFPFNAVDQDDRLAGSPNSFRFPTFFTLNTLLERRVHLLGMLWAVQAGFDNITNHRNPGAVNNNVDSPQFLTFSNFQGRALTGRIRLLGRK